MSVSTNQSNGSLSGPSANLGPSANSAEIPNFGSRAPQKPSNPSLESAHQDESVQPGRKRPRSGERAPAEENQVQMEDPADQVPADQVDPQGEQPDIFRSLLRRPALQQATISPSKYTALCQPRWDEASKIFAQARQKHQNVQQSIAKLSALLEENKPVKSWKAPEPNFTAVKDNEFVNAEEKEELLSMEAATKLAIDEVALSFTRSVLKSRKILLAATERTISELFETHINKLKVWLTSIYVTAENQTDLIKYFENGLEKRINQLLVQANSKETAAKAKQRDKEEALLKEKRQAILQKDRTVQQLCAAEAKKAAEKVAEKAAVKAVQAELKKSKQLFQKGVGKTSQHKTQRGKPRQTAKAANATSKKKQQQPSKKTNASRPSKRNRSSTPAPPPGSSLQKLQQGRQL